MDAPTNNSGGVLVNGFVKNFPEDSAKITSGGIWSFDLSPSGGSQVRALSPVNRLRWDQTSDLPPGGSSS